MRKSVHTLLVLYLHLDLRMICEYHSYSESVHFYDSLWVAQACTYTDFWLVIMTLSSLFLLLIKKVFLCLNLIHMNTVNKNSLIESTAIVQSIVTYSIKTIISALLFLNSLIWNNSENYPHEKIEGKDCLVDQL
jgi:hypothetical protein